MFAFLLPEIVIEVAYITVEAFFRAEVVSLVLTKVGFVFFLSYRKAWERE